MRKKIESILLELGITPDLKGFDYITRGVEIILQTENNKDVVKGVYDVVAKEFNTTNSKVERGIRHAFSKIDKEGESFRKYIGVASKTNSALLYTLAYRLKED